ncbi:MAG: hypothetical protein WC377_04585 [Bacteroidales bacterium]|mgnify:CR=1 FL=1|jgi:hypothetical protein|nr:hypothetical protein [Bacteroidales bacterium]MDY0359084.1 hypothetical protein [Bacteroidales bacterium]NLN37353.1 hypothetical protein [Bacteroidales bacterium]
MRWLLASLVLFFMYGCSGAVNEKLLYGTWIFQHIDGRQVHTNDFFVLSFNPDGTEMHSCALYVDSVNVRWFHGENYTYRFQSDTKRDIRISGTSPLGIPVELTLNILKLTKKRLVYFYAEPFFNGTYLSDSRIVTLRRPKSDYSQKILGKWEFEMEGQLFRIDFLDNRTCHLYVNYGGSWVVAEDSPQPYYIYGDFLVGPALKKWDAIQRNHMHHYDNWEITIRGDEMIMSAYRGIDNVHFEVKAVRK